MVALVNGAAATENTDTCKHGATPIACYVDIQPWDLEVVQIPHSEDDTSAQSLVSCLWGRDVNGKTSREPLALATRINGHNCIVVPRRAKSPRDDAGSGEEKVSWRAVLLPITQPLALLHSILAKAGHEVLIFAAPFAGRPCVVVRAADLSSVACLLVESGFAVGPSTQLCTAPTQVEARAVSSRAGVWSRAMPGEPLSQETDLPYALRFESGTGLFVDIRIPTSHANGSPVSVEASSCGACIATSGGTAWHRTVSLQPPTLSRGCSEADDDPSAWRQVTFGCTAILELVSSGWQSGLWIFSGGFFARVTGLRRGEGLLAGYCCSNARRLEHLMGDVVGAELRSQYEAILGKVERPGVLRVLRRSWIEPSDGSSPVALYDGEQSEGGVIEVDREAAMVVHHTLGGGQQRWRILAMDEDPFTPAGGCPFRIDEDYEALFKSKENSGAQSSDESGSPRRAKSKKKKKKSRSPSIVLFDEKNKRAEKDRSRDRDKKSKDRKSSSDSSESSKSRKDKGKKRGRDRDKKKGRSESSRSKDKSKKRKRDKSSDDNSKDKKRSSKEDKKRRSRSRNSGKRRSRSKSKKKKDRSRSKSKKRKDRSRSRSKKKKDRSKSKSRKRKEKRSRSASNAKKGSNSLSMKKRLGGFDSRTALSESAIAPATAGLPIIVTRPVNGEEIPALTQMQTQEIAAEIEVFLKQNVVDANAGTRLRNLPPHMARHVLNRGSLLGARDTGAVLNSRIRDAMLAGQGSMPMMSIAATAHTPGRNSAASSGIESLIARYNIDSQCAQMLRQLPVHLQALAMEMPLQEARNPSAVVMSQLQLPAFRQGAAAGAPQMFQVV